MSEGKRVLIVGANSYIGDSFARYAKAREGHGDWLDIDIVDSHTGWRMAEFEEYETVIFVAGIAHRRQSWLSRGLYYAVNRDLAENVGKKAKAAGVKQFIYISTMAVYGKTAGRIAADTLPNPKRGDYYGHSKIQGETLLSRLEDENFKLAIIRPPMVYGYGCPGKFGKLVRLAGKMPVIPNNGNKRSMIYIDNLSELLYQVAQSGADGIFCPQNAEYINTAVLIKAIRRHSGKKSLVIGVKPLLKGLMVICPPLRTAYSSLFYAAKDAAIKIGAVGFDESVKKSLGL